MPKYVCAYNVLTTNLLYVALVVNIYYTHLYIFIILYIIVREREKKPTITVRVPTSPLVGFSRVRFSRHGDQ